MRFQYQAKILIGTALHSLITSLSVFTSAVVTTLALSIRSESASSASFSRSAKFALTFWAPRPPLLLPSFFPPNCGILEIKICCYFTLLISLITYISILVWLYTSYQGDLKLCHLGSFFLQVGVKCDSSGTECS